MSQILPNLPDIQFAELQAAEIESAIITTYEKLAERTLFAGDPVRLFLESLAYLIVMQNAAIDAAGKQNLLAFASGAHLDHLGVLMDTPRLGAAPAVTTIRYTLAKVLDWALSIPVGSRVTTGNNGQVFALDRTLTIPVGELSGDVSATCIEEGTHGNGLVPGQINKMVDPIAYVKNVTNISTSVMGADVEQDDPYRARIQLAPEVFSVAGPSGAYRYHTLAVHQDIEDCAVWSPKPGTVDVRPVLKCGELPSEELLDLVRERLNGRSVRPLTDTVIVAAPETVEYSAVGGWYLHRSNEPLAESIKNQVSTAVEAYRLWQRSVPGRDINPTKLIALMERAGAKRVDLEQPRFQALEERFIAREVSYDIKFLGVEDE